MKPKLEHLGGYRWNVQSFTDPSKVYLVNLKPSETRGATCGCPAGMNGKPCKHIAWVENQIFGMALGKARRMSLEDLTTYLLVGANASKAEIRSAIALAIWEKRETARIERTMTLLEGTAN